LWVRVTDGDGFVVFESGGYDDATAARSEDDQLRTYEVRMAAGADEGFHFVLQDDLVQDNRIPPRGFVATDDTQPVGRDYVALSDGTLAHWDDAPYHVVLDAGTTGPLTVEAVLLYQTTSREYVEFLRDDNHTDDRGDVLYALWEEYDRAPPVAMAEAQAVVTVRRGQDDAANQDEGCDIGKHGSPTPGSVLWLIPVCVMAQRLRATRRASDARKVLMLARWQSCRFGSCDDEDDQADTGGGQDTGQDTTAETGEDTAEDTTAETGEDTAEDTQADTGPTPEERGEYLVTALLACGDCHTPRTAEGPDMERYLAGDPVGFDINPGDDQLGGIPVPNLTNHATGLADWDDDEIKAAFIDGVDKDDNALFSIMPYWAYHNMSDDDANAVVAYLRTLPGVDQAIPERQDLGFPFDSPALPVPVEDIPETTLTEDDENYEAAQHGRYLAGLTGICVDCHTAENQAGPVPVDTTAILAGGRAFPRELLGLGDPWPEIIYTRNLTPDDTGIAGWTPEAIATALLEGTDVDGQGLCPPMPSGPMGPFGNLTDEDALAIGHYLTTIEPVANEIPADCVPPPPE
jgi:mono/diheme cytochrome c family protein